MEPALPKSRRCWIRHGLALPLLALLASPPIAGSVRAEPTLFGRTYASPSYTNRAYANRSQRARGRALPRTRQPAGRAAALARQRANAAAWARVIAYCRAMGARIDRLLARYRPPSRMAGYGTFIAWLSVYHGVPLDLALAMLGHESTFCSRGRSVRWNNPGNLRDLRGRYGSVRGAEDGYAVYASMQEGIAAYFRLLADPRGPFRKYVQQRNYAALYRVYAPASDGNDTAEYRRDTEKIRRFVIRELSRP